MMAMVVPVKPVSTPLHPQASASSSGWKVELKANPMYNETNSAPNM